MWIFKDYIVFPKWFSGGTHEKSEGQGSSRQYHLTPYSKTSLLRTPLRFPPILLDLLKDNNKKGGDGVGEKAKTLLIYQRMFLKH